MSPRHDVDVLVIGAGPAGAAAACTASRAGLRVLLADDGLPPPGHDIMVSSAAVGLLADLGAELPPHHDVGMFELLFPDLTRQITDVRAAIMDARALRARLAEAARAAGAELIAARAGDPSPAADGLVSVPVGGTTVRARHVVTARGASGGPPASAASGPSMRSGPTTPSAGFACAGRFGGIDLTERVLLAPVTPAADPRSLPAMVTVLPAGDGTATIWLARLGGPTHGDPSAALTGALAAVARRDRRLAAARPLGRVTAGPLPAGFSPQSLASATELVAGDAAGLVNPFTGEGLGAALLSGTLAAEVIARHPGDAAAAREEYARQLTAGYVGYFETARHAARRYHLVWRMLEAAAASDHVFLARARRAVLLPRGTEAVADQRVPVPRPDRVVSGPFLLACDEVQVSTLRGQWPFLARLLADGSGLTRHRIRSGLLFLAGLLAEDRRPGIAHATPAAATELAAFGALALVGAEEGQRAVTRGVDWAGATLVLAGDFLLSQASRLIAESAPGLSWSFADWLAELAQLRAERLDARPGKATALHASLMEFPARAGALAGGCDDATVAVMRGIGSVLGEAFAHAEDVLALCGQRTRLDATLAAMVAAKTSAISQVTGTEPGLVDRRLADPGFRAAALAESRLACDGAIGQARAMIAAVPGAMARRVLEAYAAAIEPGEQPVTAPRQRHGSG